MRSIPIITTLVPLYRNRKPALLSSFAFQPYHFSSVSPNGEDAPDGVDSPNGAGALEVDSDGAGAPDGADTTAESDSSDISDINDMIQARTNKSFHGNPRVNDNKIRHAKRKCGRFLTGGVHYCGEVEE